MLRKASLSIRISLFAACVPLLSRLPIRRIYKIVEPDGDVLLADPGRVEQIIRCVDWYCRVARPLITRRCMTRGLTLYYFLRRAGVETSLVFGVGNDLERFTGHCWLVRDGEPYLEKTDPRAFFTSICSFRHHGVEYEASCLPGGERG